MEESPGRESNGIRLISADKDAFEPSKGLSTLQAEDLFKVVGPNELPEKKDPYVSSSYLPRPLQACNVFDKN